MNVVWCILSSSVRRVQKLASVFKYVHILQLVSSTHFYPTAAHLLVLQVSSHLCHRAGHPNLCHTHTSRVRCKCHDHTQETSRTRRTDHPSSHNDTYRDRERLQQTGSEKKTQTKASRYWIWHASALCGACRQGVIFLKAGRTHLQSPGRSQEPWSMWHPCLHTAR